MEIEEKIENILYRLQKVEEHIFGLEGLMDSLRIFFQMNRVNPLEVVMKLDSSRYEDALKELK